MILKIISSRPTTRVTSPRDIARNRCRCNNPQPEILDINKKLRSVCSVSQLSPMESSLSIVLCLSKTPFSWSQFSTAIQKFCVILQDQKMCNNGSILSWHKSHSFESLILILYSKSLVGNILCNNLN